MGRLEKLKGLDELIEAVAILLDTDLRIRLLIVGDGITSAYLEQARKYASKISFLGRLSKEELYELYQIADIGVIPSKNEQCNYVAIEMMMFDIPLVISSTSGLKEMTDLAKVVEIKEVDKDTLLSAKDLAEAIKSQLQHPIKGTRADFLRKYTLDNMGLNMLKVYN